MTRLIWNAVLIVSLTRLIIQQFLLGLGQAPILPEFDLQLIFLAAVGLFINLNPGIITPGSLDVMYVITSLLSIVCVMQGNIDAARYASFSFRAELFFATLTKRLWCVFFCNFISFAFTIHLSRKEPETSGCNVSDGWLTMWLLCMAALFCARRIFWCNTNLKLDLKKRSVELGVVSSLLLVCYDAVVEVDEDLNLTEHSPQLSSLLLHGRRPIAGMTGQSFLECFDVQDQDRLRKQFIGSSSIGGSTVMALNADMVDADQNRVKVELLHAPFESLSNEKHFLIGIRELQGLDALAPLPERDRRIAAPQWEESTLPELPDVSSAVGFEVPSFEILTMGEEIEELCQQLGSYPQNILDLASDQTRYSLCDQLQVLANRAAAAPPETPADTKVSFTLGHKPISAWVTFEFDSLLDALVGSLEVCPQPGNRSLTEANLQKLNEPQPHRSQRSRSLRPSRSGQPGSHRTTRSASRRSSESHSLDSFRLAKRRLKTTQGPKGGLRKASVSL